MNVFKCSLVIDPRGKLGGLRGKVGNLRTMRVVYWVNVFDSSSAGSHRLSGIKDHYVVAAVCVTVCVACS